MCYFEKDIKNGIRMYPIHLYLSRVLTPQSFAGILEIQLTLHNTTTVKVGCHGYLDSPLSQSCTNFVFSNSIFS